jgi:peptide deformylase
MYGDSDPGNLVFYPSEVLRDRAIPLTKIDGYVQALSNVMVSTLLAAKGLGIAAPQIGLPARMIVVTQPRKPGDYPLTLINPEIIWKSEELSVHAEGCLSIPGVRARIERPSHVRATFLDLDGNAHEIEADGMLARCIQHEVDHLDGKLIIDHLSEAEREALLKAYGGPTRDIHANTYD